MPNWYAKQTGSYSRTSDEGIANARAIAEVLTAAGWGISAICALLGNGAGESGLNPWRWQGDNVPTRAQYEQWTQGGIGGHAYGLYQFDPASRYIVGGASYNGYAPNFSDDPGQPSDGSAQTAFLANIIPTDWSHNLYSYYADDFLALSPPVDISLWYYMTFADYIDEGSAYPLAAKVGAFELCFERPGDSSAASSYAHRCAEAQAWLDYFGGHPVSASRVWLYKYYLNHKRRWRR